MAKKIGPKKNGPEKTRTIKTKKGGTVTVRKKTVDDAMANKGEFKERPAYKGKVIKSSTGSMSGIKTHEGTYIRTATPAARKRATKTLARDRKLHKADSTAHSKRIKRFQRPVSKKK